MGVKMNQSTRLSYAELKMIGLLGKKLNGSSAYIKKHKSRALIIARVIDERFHKHVYKAKLKHFKWLLSYKNKDLKPEVQYQYWLTVRMLIKLLNKEQLWLCSLVGNWCFVNGKLNANEKGAGRKVKLVSYA